MAEQVTEEVAATLAWGGRVAYREYDWDNWLNGQWWHLKFGEDYDTEHSLNSAARNAAKARGLKVTIRGTHDGNVLLKAISKDVT